MRCDYTVGDKRQYVVWHSSFSDTNAPKIVLKQLRQTAEILELCKEARKKYEIELIARVHESAEWEAYEDFAEVWLKEITAKLEGEAKGTSGKLKKIVAKD